MKNILRQRGVAAIEFGILLIPLIIMTFGMTELGRAVYYYNGIVSSTRAAARYLGTYHPGEAEAAARCIAVHGNPGCTGPTLVPGLTTDMVKISYESNVDTGAGSSIELVRVSVEGYSFSSLVPMVVANLTFAPVACTMRQPVA